MYVVCTHKNRHDEAILMSTHYIMYFHFEENQKDDHIMLLDLAVSSTFIGSNYPYLEQIFIVSKVFEPSKFDCISY